MQYDFDKIYIDDTVFPYTPVHEQGKNDVDLDPYTNTLGYTMRNRVREGVAEINFDIKTLVGEEFYKILDLTKKEYFNCTFFYAPARGMVTRKMYCSPIKWTDYYIDKQDINKNIFTDIKFGFVEQ